MYRDFNLDIFAEFIPMAMAAVGIAGSIWSARLRRRLNRIGFEK
jgi:hypothetical protein